MLLSADAIKINTNKRSTHLFDQKIVLSYPDIEMFPYTVGGREYPARCYDRTPAEDFLVPVQDGNHPGPMAARGLATAWGKKRRIGG